MNRTAAIVVTYNRKDCLKESLAALLSQSVGGFDILVIDNASDDGTQQAVSQFSNERIRYYNTGANLGGAGGFNYGVRKACELGYERVWLMDDDCYPHPDAYEQLVAADQKLDDFGFLSSVALFTDGELCNMNIQRSTYRHKIDNFSGELIPSAMATFVSLYMPTDKVYQIGLPISDFFIWSDDLEYTRRLSLRWPCYVVPSSKVTHAMKSNAKVNIATEQPDRLGRYAYLYRNEVYVFRREGLKGWIYMLERVALHCVRVLFKGGKGRFKKLGVILSSFFKGFGFNPTVEYPDTVKGDE